MSEPFWKGKTCKELEGARVKVTYKNGTVLTGELTDDGCILLGSNTEGRFGIFWQQTLGGRIGEPESTIASVELVDDPDYERIDDFKDVHKGDIVVCKSGNRYEACGRTVSNISVLLNDENLSGRNTASFIVGEKQFDHALRWKPLLPNKPGLWVDKNGGVWVYADNSFSMRCIGAPFTTGERGWCLDGTKRMVDHAGDLAPFRPYTGEES